MKRFIILFFTIFIFSGCTLKLDLDIIKKDTVYQNALQHTKRAEIIKELDTKATISATYLNLVDSTKYNKDDSFLVAIYKPNKRYTLLDWGYSLTLNNNGFKSIEKVKEDSEIHQRFPFLNKWAKYYIVKFKKTESNILNLEYKHIEYGKVNMTFKKDL
jgi:hypothetical protein